MISTTPKPAPLKTYQQAMETLMALIGHRFCCECRGIHECQTRAKLKKIAMHRCGKLYEGEARFFMEGVVGQL